MKRGTYKDQQEYRRHNDQEKAKCRSKVPFTSAQAAQSSQGRRSGVNAYRCTWCKLFHLGHTRYRSQLFVNQS